MFKRLRENLFGRQAQEEATEQEYEEEQQPGADAETASEDGRGTRETASALAEPAAPSVTPAPPGALRGPFAPPAPTERALAAEPPAVGSSAAPSAPEPLAPPPVSAPPKPTADAITPPAAPAPSQHAAPVTPTQAMQVQPPKTEQATTPAAEVVGADERSAGSKSVAPAVPPTQPKAASRADNSSRGAPPPARGQPVVTPGPEAAPAPEVASEQSIEAEEWSEPELEPEAPEERRGMFRNPFRLGLGRTRQLFGRVNEAFQSDEISDDLWDELEETLISADVGVGTTEHLMEILRERTQAEGLQRGAQLRDALKEELELLLGEPEPLVFSDTSPLSIFLVVGVNGVGKTTSIAKLGNLLKRQRHRVMLAAGDTFRAAATEQIKTWGERVGVPVISHQYGADPAAVVYDAVQAAQARGADVLIVDTAGRLHTKFNLMEELKKIGRVLQKYDAEAPHEVLLVIDATTGQNGYLQAKQFVADSGVSGVILTKLDGTARGGIVFAVASELGLPIKFVGTGEQVKDIAPFDPQQFVDALFEED